MAEIKVCNSFEEMMDMLRAERPTSGSVEPLGGKKESDGKLFYELDWEFIEAMAKRMEYSKKGKYPRFNWKKPMDVESLNQAAFRHMIEIMKGKYKDDGDDLGHLLGVACNMMMVYYQLKKR